MANNQYINKVDFGSDTLIDLTGDTATASDVLTGQTFHLASGAPATGTLTPGDMLESDYDSSGDVKTAGGIDAYVQARIDEFGLYIEDGYICQTV